MATFHHEEPERLEDSLRRMILTNASAQPDVQSGVPQAQPTVRLPPSGSYGSPNQARNRFGNQQYLHDATGLDQHSTPRFPVHNHGQNANQQHYRQRHGPPNHGRHNQFTNFQQQPRQFNHNGQPVPSGNFAPHQRARYQQQMPIDPNAFHRGNFGRGPGSGTQQQQLFNPNQPRGPPINYQAEQQAKQSQYLEQVAATEIRNVDMSRTEYDEKESFWLALERVCVEVCDADPERLPKISLQPFGSFKSGFATAGSDMDLAIVVEDSDSASACFSLLEDDLPRALEKRLLQLGYGARLLTRTRVPIIKVCEKPELSFLDKLREEREKWDFLPNELKYPHLHENGIEDDQNEAERPATESVVKKILSKEDEHLAETNGVLAELQQVNGNQHWPVDSTVQTSEQAEAEANGRPQKRREESKPWTRERKAGPLDFPKLGVGVQCDINFFNPLGLHNTQLLRCYSLCDQRVRPLILFVKAWAKRRKINSSYSGTLSSYGYVLMVLHYLTNVANPPVLPNLQAPLTPLGDQLDNGEVVDGWNVNFWRNENEIVAAGQGGQLTNNREPLGSLLAGFFQYYSSMGGGATFRWMQEVLSLRSRGGLLTKEEKGWVKAVTEEGGGKKVQHRYLFCIEDPFELNHNVARTVTHNGIVAIRDEFRRARRILQAIGNGLFPKEGELFSDLVETADFLKASEELKASATKNGMANGTQEPVVQATQAAHDMNQLHHGKNYQAHPKPRPNRAMGTGHLPQKQMKALNVQDSEAFPTLGAAKPSKKKALQPREQNEEFSEISGDQAKAYLEEVKRKKDEAHAEFTATGAAEAVLGDSD